MNFRKIVVAALGALFVATIVFAANKNTTWMGNYYQNATNGSVVDSAGKALVAFGDQESDYILKYRGVINDSLGKSLPQDSTRTPLATFKVSRGYVIVSANMVTPATGVTAMRIAVSVTGTYSSTYSADSSYTFDVTNQYTDFATKVDTVSVFEMDSGSPKVNALASTEFVVNLQKDASVAGAVGARPTAMAVPLIDHTGMWIHAPYLNIKVRILNTSGTTARVPVRVDYIGYIK